MEYVLLSNGIKMPMVGYGTWQLRDKQCESCVLTAIDIGYRLIDTAQMYGNEKAVGNAVAQSALPRKELFITTKICYPADNYDDTLKAIERSLNDLQTNYIDLILIHEAYDAAPEMYAAMYEALTKGKIRALGVSNFKANFFKNFIKSCPVVPVINQMESHVFFPQLEYKKELAKNGTLMQAWSPFAAGKHNIFSNDILCFVGKKYNKSPAQIALKFLVQKGIPAVPKSSHKERMIENFNIFDFQLTEQDMSLISLLDDKKSLFGWY